MSNEIKEQAYGMQKNREHMYFQAQAERKEMKKNLNDISAWDSADEAWADYRYMELCEKCNITPW